MLPPSVLSQATLSICIRRVQVANSLETAINELEMYASSAQVPQALFKLVGEVCRAAREAVKEAPTNLPVVEDVTEAESPYFEDAFKAKIEGVTACLSAYGFKLLGISIAPE